MHPRALIYLGALLATTWTMGCDSGSPTSDGGGGSGGIEGGGGSGGTDGGGGTGGTDGSGGTGGTDGGGGTGGTEEDPGLGSRILGTVIDDRGQPFAGVRVAINHDFDDVMVTDDDGAFSSDGVELPYDLTLLLPSGELVELQALTRREPRVGLFDNAQGLSRATVSGTIMGTEELPPDDAIGIWATRSPQTSIEVGEAGVFAGEVAWLGPTPHTVDLVAAHVGPDQDGNLVYRGSAILKDVILEKDATLSDLEIELPSTPIPTFQTRLDVDFGAFVDERISGIQTIDILGARFEYPNQFQSGPELPNGTDVSLPVEGGRLFFSGTAENGTFAMRMVQVTSAGTTQIHLPTTQPLAGLAPQDGASDVSRLPEFRWSPVPGAKGYWIEVREAIENQASHRHQYYLPASVSSFDLAAIGSDEAKLHGATTYSWSVTASMSDGALDANTIATGTGMGAIHIFTIDEFSGFRTKEHEFVTAP